MANPLVKFAVIGSGIIAGIVSNKVLSKGWGLAFGEEPPTSKALKRSAKETKAAQRQAKKDGLGKADVRAITDPHDEDPIWKTMLWLVLSGIVVKTVREYAKRGTQKGSDRIFARRPRANRG